MPNSPGWKTVLEDGLVMRGATRDDADRLAEFNTVMHSDEDEPLEWMREWTRDLVLKPLTSISLDDIIIIEDARTGEIVSSCVYYHRDWSYCGIPVPFGRPELVSTHPDYRNRGLVRRQFELMHRWGDERGHLVQGITGIPYYYRQFGYELALEMESSRNAYVSKMPKWKDDEQKTLALRNAERSDLPLMVQLHANATARSLFAPVITTADLEYQLFDRHADTLIGKTASIMEDEAGSPIGFTSFVVRPEFESAEVSMLEFVELSMFSELTQPFLKSFRSVLEQVPESNGKSVQHLSVKLSEAHPAQAFFGNPFARGGRSYSWYMRTPDLPKLLRLIAPKLEERLLGTVFEGLTGEKVLNFYRSGLLLKFEEGKITGVETVKFPERGKSMANLPDLTFLQLLFGRRSISEISHILVDARANSDADELLIDTLFPKMSSEAASGIG